MTKRQIDFEVYFALNEFITITQKMGADIDPEKIEEYRLTLEGIAVRELAEREGEKCHSLLFSSFEC